jgi:hypothetical protein
MKPKNIDDISDSTDELSEYEDDLADFDDSWFGDQEIPTDWNDGLLDEEFDDE